MYVGLCGGHLRSEPRFELPCTACYCHSSLLALETCGGTSCNSVWVLQVDPFAACEGQGGTMRQVYCMEQHVSYALLFNERHWPSFRGALRSCAVSRLLGVVALTLPA